MRMNTQIGMKQGDALLPLLFIFPLDYATDICLRVILRDNTEKRRQIHSSENVRYLMRHNRL
jgi:hypothetical protein